MKLKIDGKKVNAVCAGAIIASAALAYSGILPIWVAIVTVEIGLVIMALRSTARKLDTKLEEIQKKDFHVTQKPSILSMR